jgi:acyl-[acyl-carrier-protein]-phospholipid O-acyltransferase/long-chain-fatty-acid--[acyl-carrier-protein] ligase
MAASARQGRNTAVILFTSGSEGQPKGVELTHNNLLANIAQIESRIRFSPADKLFNVLPVFHSFGLTGGTILPLANGVHILFYPSPLHFRQIPEIAS